MKDQTFLINGVPVKQIDNCSRCKIEKSKFIMVNWTQRTVCGYCLRCLSTKTDGDKAKYVSIFELNLGDQKCTNLNTK